MKELHFSVVYTNANQHLFLLNDVTYVSMCLCGSK
jgi:hypothetical protein